MIIFINILKIRYKTVQNLCLRRLNELEWQYQFYNIKCSMIPITIATITKFMFSIFFLIKKNQESLFKIFDFVSKCVGGIE